jgi:nicotinate dehydrogenase large molybdopterin subunit
MKAVGEGFVRPDAYDKALGKAVYPDDIDFEGMLYAGVKRSTIAYGKLKSINIDEIRQMSGVECVIDYSMIPGEITHGVVFKDTPILVKDLIKRVGDALLLVVAIDKRSLARALDAVKVEYEEYKGIFTVEDALKPGAPILGDGSNILYDIKIKTGDIEKGFEEAKFITENWYNTPMVEHAFLQPEAAVARMVYGETETDANNKSNTDADGDSDGDGDGGTHSEADTTNGGVMEVFVATQYPHYDREEVARCLNFKEERVKINNTIIGGAFGAREDINPQCHAAIAAYLTKKPVKVVYSREESTISHSKRHPMKMYFKTGVTADGKLCALQARIYGDTGAYASWGMNVLRKAAVHATGPYVIPNVDIQALAVYTNNPYSGAMRGFGATQVPLATESQMDILAEMLRMQPLNWTNFKQ